MSDETRLEVRCPKCGSPDIRERNVAYADLRVLSWKRDGDVIAPSEYDTDAAADWEAQDISHQYVCHNCGRGMRLLDLTGTEVPDV